MPNYRMLNKVLWAGIALFTTEFCGKAAVNLAAPLYSTKVPETQAEQFVSDLATIRGFDEDIEVKVQDGWCGSEPATSTVDPETGRYSICVSRGYLRESVLRHETKHIVSGHLALDRGNLLKREAAEWDATLYGLGFTK